MNRKPSAAMKGPLTVYACIGHNPYERKVVKSVLACVVRAYIHPYLKHNLYSVYSNPRHQLRRASVPPFHGPWLRAQVRK
jgi:hypothetical protein